MYETHVITLNTSRNFSVALSDTPFQEHYSNHKRDFTIRHYVKSIELSKYIWNLQESGKEFTIHWENLSHIQGMTKRGYCSLCWTEKLWLLHYSSDMHWYGCSIILTICTYLNSLANANMRLNYWYHQLKNLSQKTNSMINLNEYFTNRC